MDGSHEGSGSSSPAPFLTKTYEMVDDPATDAVVSWSSTSSSFVVWKPLEFARDLLPKYFKHNNFSSFVRQLNTYGFRKVDPDQWEFANEEFVQGQRQLLKNIHRRKPVHSHSLQPNALRHLAEDEKHELEEEIEKLRREKGTLILELEKHSQQQHGMERQMQCLEERLHLVEQRQRGIVSFLGKVAQRPGFLSDLLYKSDLHHKRRLPKLDYLFQDANMEDDQIVAFETMSLEKHNHGGIQIFDTEPFDKMDSCIHSLEAFFLGAIDATVGSMCYDDGLPSQPCLEDIHSSSELVESMSHVASENQKDEDRDVLEMDVKSETSVHEIHTSTNQATKTTAIVNDVFWEQFLTETPASSQTQEAFQLECKDVKDDQRNVERRS